MLEKKNCMWRQEVKIQIERQILKVKIRENQRGERKLVRERQTKRIVLERKCWLGKENEMFERDIKLKLEPQVN